MNPEMESIQFFSRTDSCSGWLLRPAMEDRIREGKVPCVILAHGFGGTIGAGLLPYAKRFSELGFYSLLFDYRHFGQSEGEPRQLISIRRQLQDWKAAISFARSRTEIDPDRIALWGSSFSGGHVVAAAAADGRVAGVVSQCPMMDGVAALFQLFQYAGAGYLLRLCAKGFQDALCGVLGMQPVMLPIVGPPGTLAAMSTEDAEPGYRAIAPDDWRNEACARISLSVGGYRPGRVAGKLPCPILIQICDRDRVAPPSAAVAAARNAGTRATVKHYPIGHFDIYVGAAFERSVGDQGWFLTSVLS
jgi:pimeloyl-ACP methyl ester carboxylesterase